MVNRRWVLAVLVCLGGVMCAPMVSAGVEEGVAAAEKGDYVKALKDLQPLATAGNADAQYNMGWLYQRGRGVKQDDAQAFAWFLKAGEQGLPEAQFEVGVAFDEGRGIGKDYARAAEWYRKSAQQGYANAQFNLATMYTNGDGVEQNYLRAYVWFNLAASQGIEMAYTNRARVEAHLSEEQKKSARELSREYYTKYMAPHVAAQPLRHSGMPPPPDGDH